MDSWIHSFSPTKISLEYNCLPKVGNYLKNVGKRILIVNTQSANTQVQYEEELLILEQGIKQAVEHCVIYDYVYEDINHDFLDTMTFSIQQSYIDLIIAFGGLKSINTAKIVSLLATNQLFASELLEGKAIYSDAIPLVSIPIWPLLGEEIGIASFLCTADNLRVGKHIFHDSTIPKICFYDPKINGKLSVDHASKISGAIIVSCIESLLKAKSNIFQSTTLKKAMNSITTYAIKFAKQPFHEEFSSNIFATSCLLGQSLYTCPPGIAWSLSHTMHMLYNIDFHYSMSVLIPHVINFYLSKNSGACAHIAPLMDIDTLTLKQIEVGTQVINTINGLFQQLNLPTALSELNFQKNNIANIAESAISLVYLDEMDNFVTIQDLEAILLAAL